MDSKKKILPLPPHKIEIPCRGVDSQLQRFTPGKPPVSYVQRRMNPNGLDNISEDKEFFKDALPRGCKFAYMTPSHYATGFRILDIYKTKSDFSEMRSLLFLEDPKQVKKWGLLKSRLPYPETRVTDLPGTRELHYKNYCLRSLTPESSSSWRKSLRVPTPLFCEEEAEEDEQKAQGDGS